MSGVESVAFSPDGRRIVSGSDDQAVRIWEAASGKQVGSALVGHMRAVTAVAFSPDGRSVVSASYDDTVRIWDVASSLHRFPNGLPEGYHWGRCLLAVHGKTLISGRCGYHVSKGGGFEIAGPRQVYEGIDFPLADCGCAERSNDYWANVFKEKNGAWTGYGNSDIVHTHGDGSYEVLHRRGACLVNEEVRVCFWK